MTKLLILSLLSISLYAQEPKAAPPAPPPPLTIESLAAHGSAGDTLLAETAAPPKITPEAQAEYQTLRARLAEAQSQALQAQATLQRWIEQRRLLCALEIRDGDQIACAKEAPTPKPEAGKLIEKEVSK